MKRLVMVSIALVLGAGPALATDHAKKGGLALSGELGFVNTDQENGGDTTQVVIAPTFRYFVADSFAVGGKPLYQSASSGSSDNTLRLFGAVGLVGLHHPTSSDRAIFFVGELQAGIVTGSAEGGFSGESIDLSGTLLAARLGLAFAVGAEQGGFVLLGAGVEKVTLEGEAGGQTAESKTTQVGLIAEFGLFL